MRRAGRRLLPEWGSSRREAGRAVETSGRWSRMLVSSACSVAVALCGAILVIGQPSRESQEPPAPKKPPGTTGGTGLRPSPATPEDIMKAPKDEPRLGSLTIRSLAPGAEVLLDGKPLGDVGPQRIVVISNLPQGTYRITARRHGYKPWEREIRVAPGSHVEVVVEFEP